MKENLVLRHAQLDATRMMLWDLALETEDCKESNTLLDAMDLVMEEMIKIELTAEWEEQIYGASEVK